MRGAGDHYSVGERIAFSRRRRGLTQRVLANLVGRSEDWLSKVERNERDVRRLDVINDVAHTLRVSVGDLLGQPVLVEDSQPQDYDVPAVRDALMSHRRLSRTLFGRQAATSVSAAVVWKICAHAWDEYQAGRVGRVIAALPNLIKSAGARGDRSKRRGLAHLGPGSSSGRYDAGQDRRGGFGLDRRRAGDGRRRTVSRSAGPRLGRTSRRPCAAVSGPIRRRIESRTDRQRLATQISADNPAALSIAGMLSLRTSIAAARRQDRSLATQLLADADRAAQRLGRDANYWHTCFGPTNVQLHRIATALDLGDIQYVADHGDEVDPTALPAERSVTHKIDMARALSYLARDDEALAQLLDAEKCRPADRPPQRPSTGNRQDVAPPQPAGLYGECAAGRVG